MKNKRECSSFSLDKKNHCHINGFALSLALKHRLGATRKSPKRTKNFQFTCLEVHCTVNTNHVWSAEWGYHMAGLGWFRNLGPRCLGKKFLPIKITVG